MKHLKPVVFLVLALVLVAQPMTVRAVLNDESKQVMEFVPIAPFWQNVQHIVLDLQFTGSTAECSGVVRGNSGTTRITATFTLERQNANGTWSSVASWSESADDSLLTFSASHSSVTTTGNTTYRLRVTALVTRNGVTEVATFSVTNRN